MLMMLGLGGLIMMLGLGRPDVRGPAADAHDGWPGAA